MRYLFYKSKPFYQSFVRTFNALLKKYDYKCISPTNSFRYFISPISIKKYRINFNPIRFLSNAIMLEVILSTIHMGLLIIVKFLFCSPVLKIFIYNYLK